MGSDKFDDLYHELGVLHSLVQLYADIDNLSARSITTRAALASCVDKAYAKYLLLINDTASG